MHALFLYLRYTFRLLRKSPGFTITAVLILSFGIGVNTAIFSLMDAAVLKPLPFPDPDRLVEVCTPYQKESFHWMDYPDYLDLAAAQHSFESLAALSVPLALDLGGNEGGPTSSSLLCRTGPGQGHWTPNQIGALV